MKLSAHQRDRAIGSIIASAAGDALGAPHEFKPPVGDSFPLAMTGGGSFGWTPGEWTDDTSMALVILGQLMQGRGLSDEATLDSIVEEWREWAAEATDVGIQTRAVLGGATAPTAAAARTEAEQLHRATGRTAGNGSLMRTGPVALGSLDSAAQTAANARAISQLTHWDSTAGDACVLWSVAIRHAILTGVIDIRVGMEFLDDTVRDYWLALIQAAEAGVPSDFSRNGWVIEAFQGAWSAISRALRDDSVATEADRLRIGIEHAVRGGYDTDTVAAIAGSLLGAGLGVTAVPAEWRLVLHGWPDITEREVTAMTVLAINGGAADPASGWPTTPHFDYSTSPQQHELTQLPADPGVWLGGFGSLQVMPDEVTAVVSLCRMGTQDVPERIGTRLEILLIDSANPQDNMNTEFVLADVALAVHRLRERGEVVFLHCVQSHSRTPSVAAAYGMRHRGQGLDEALGDIQRVLPNAHPNAAFMAALRSLDARAGGNA